jgi:hypothetical protein
MCWLCKFNTHKDAMDMNQFIFENIAAMPVEALAREVFNELEERQPNLQSNDASIAIIIDHINTHTLNPTIRLGLSLRHMLDLSNKVRGQLDKVDATGQNLGLDPKMLDSYIRLQSQILNMYKSETNRMMFSSASGSN